MFKKKNRIKKEEGFTLVELMVATTVFVVIVISSIGSLLALMGASKDSRGLRFSMDNISFAMESMTRSIRMGVNYYCGDSIPDSLDTYLDCSTEGKTLFSFVPQLDGKLADERVSYRLKKRETGVDNYTIQRCVGTVESGCIEIVSSDININKLVFYVSGSNPYDSTQANVYILLKGTIDVKGKPASFMIQTMASQRNY